MYISERFIKLSRNNEIESYFEKQIALKVKEYITSKAKAIIIKLRISLTPFDYSYYKSLPSQDRSEIKYDRKSKPTYQTILIKNNKVGIVGIRVLPLDKYNESKIKYGFSQVIVSKKYRGKGIAGLSIDMLAEKLNMDVVFASIKATNKSSIKAHEKVKFEKLSDDRIKSLHKSKKLPHDMIRLQKIYRRNAND